MDAKAKKGTETTENKLKVILSIIHEKKTPVELQIEFMARKEAFIHMTAEDYFSCLDGL